MRLRSAGLTSLTLLIALALAACGGGGGDDSQAQGPTKKEDEAAVEQVLLAYGASEGTDVCTYYAANQIKATGGVDGCESANSDTSSAVFKVRSVAVNGDEAVAAVTVAGQAGEVSSYQLAREHGKWKISGFPDDDPVEGSGASDPAPVSTSEQAPPEALQPATPRVIVDDLLNDFGKASGTEICDFFSTSFIASQQGGRAGCEKIFGSLGATNYKPVAYDFYGKTTAKGILRNSSGEVVFQADVTEPPDSLYGGWRITRFVPD